MGGIYKRIFYKQTEINMVTHQQLQEAKEYIDYGIKEGYFNEEDFENLTDEEFVKKAQELRDKGDAASDKWKEDYGEI